MAATYNYQLQYEMCSLLFLLAITFQFLNAKKFPTRTNWIFTLILLCSVGSLSTDIIGSLTVMHVIDVPLWLNYLINGSFYFLQITIPGLTCIYVLVMTGCSFKKNPKLFLIMIPACMFMLLQLINPFTKMFFYFTVIDGVDVFCNGPLYLLYYGGAFFYEMVLISLIFILRNRLNRMQFLTISFFTLIMAVAMIVQMLNPDLILTGTAITMSIMLWDLTLQNPENMLDSETRLFDSTALKLFLDDRIKSYKSFVTVMEISGFNSTEREMEDTSSRILMASIGKFLSSLSSGSVWCFRDSKTRFWVGAKNKLEMEEVSSRIVERFRRPWDAGGISIDLMAKVLSVDVNISFKITTPELIAIIDELLDEERTFTDQKKTVNIDFNRIAGHRRRQLIEESMRRSIKTGEGFRICFQPILDMDDSSFSSAEVLLRYNDPHLGAVSPTEFMQVIEQGGMAIFIDSFVVDIACRFISSHPEIDQLHINLSGAEFFHNPVKRISEIVRRNGVDPARICFEITESVAARNPEQLMSFMTEMIRLGFSFALDDFGTGYSNVLQVRDMPFSTAKIDKSLLDDAEKGRKILESTVRLFSDLGLDIVVEGIESEETLNCVLALGARKIQGFLFSPPLEENDYIAFVHKGNRLS